MPRPRRRRHIRFRPNVVYFKPRSVPISLLEEVGLELDELEAIRLKDVEDLDQEQSAKKMKISTSTFQRILNSAHYKIADALIHGKAISIRKEVINMPGLDGTGPKGEGPRTGGGYGNCDPADQPSSGKKSGLGLARGNRRRAPSSTGRGLARGRRS